MSEHHSVFSAQKLASIRLNSIPGVGPKSYRQLLKFFGDAEKVLGAKREQLRQVQGIGEQLATAITNANKSVDLNTLVQLCQQHEIGIVTREEAHYPDLLKEIPDPPNLFYIKGTLKPCDSIAIAVVGSRHATHYGLSQAESLGRALALAGITVVSGMARGIDAAAHRGALKAGGRTIAVLGSGLLNIYPTEHQGLAQEIAAQGAVISESHPNQPPKSGAFPQRNRIVTGLSLGTLVVEAAQRSGALISARLAMEQDREVFAVPGPVTSRMSRGCHRLIQDGAKLVGSIDDILDELGPLAMPANLGVDHTVRHPAELKLSEQESKILNAIQLEPTQLDEVVHHSGLPAQRVLSTVSVLEMRKLIRRISGTTVVRL